MNNEYFNLAIIVLIFGSIMLVALIPDWVFRVTHTITLWMLALGAVFGSLWHIIGYVEF